jgi:hypothetical protein
MTTDPADPFREHDAAYVLGALSGDDRRAFESHLSACPECAASVRALAGLPGLLAAVPRPVAETEPVEPPPDTLLPQLVRQVRRETRRRRWTVGLVAAASAGVIGVGGLVVEAQRAGDPVVAATPGPTPTATAPERAMAPVSASQVSASIALVGVAWGTRIELTCTYAQGGKYAQTHPDESYVLVVRDRAGRSEQVAHWRALPGRTMRVTGASAFSLNEIASVELQSHTGQPLLALQS